MAKKKDTRPFLVKIPKTAINYKMGRRYRNPKTGDEYFVLPFGFRLKK